MKKRLLSLLLVAILLMVSAPVSTVNVFAADASHTVDASTAADRTNTLVNSLTGKYFTTTQSSCGNNKCDYCKNTNVIKAAWLKNTMGLVPDDVSLLPEHYYNSSGVVTSVAWSCAGFANYCLWYIYAKNSSDNVRRVNIYTGTFTKSNMDNSGVRTGDAIRINNSHSFIYISHNSSGVTVLDSNWSSQYHNLVQKHVIKWSYNSGTTMAITRGKNWTAGSHTHYYSGSYYEAAHPHRVYQKCSCGATSYTGANKTVSSCSECSFTQDSKYNTVKGFKSYPCVTSNFEVKTSDLSTRNGEIYTTDYCTINELYTNGWCKVTFPLDSGGTKVAYTKISNFVKTPSASLTKYTADKYINLYSTSSLSTKIYRIYPNDICYTIGTSGSATQIFMPMSGGNYYVLGWVSTSDLNSTPVSAEELNPGLKSLNSSVYAKCYTIANSRYNVYTSSSLSTRGFEGTSSSTAWTGESDEIWIIGVGVNSSGTAYAKIKYPIGSSRYTAYVPLHSTLVPGSLTGSYRTATTKVSGFSDRPGGSANSSYWVDAGEKVYLLSQQNGYSQILYPTSGTAWRIAWCSDSVYNSMFKAQTYTVSYNANGGSGAPSSQTKTRDVALTLSSSKPTRTGYTFVGWSISSSASSAQYSAGSIYTDESSVTLYAVWRKQSFTVSYNANGGVNAPGVQTQTYGTAITVTTQTPTKTYKVTFNANGGAVSTNYSSLDCTFTGWNTNSSGTGTTVKSGASYTPNANVTLYAVYNNPTLGNYPFPERTGYVFVGWYTAASGGTKLSSTSVITASTTLYAHWDLETYTVYYYADDASNIPDEQIKTYGTALTLSSAIPTKTGYTFNGWTTEEGSSSVDYSPGANYTDNESVILYAVWSCAHPYDSGKITTAATCTSTGIKTYTCTNCGKTKTETIAKNSSNHAGGTTIKNAKSATCSSEGYTGDKYCSGCGVKLSTGQTIAKTAHSYNSGAITTAATCTTAGVKTYTCTVCKTTKTETIAALGHNFNGASRTNSDGSVSYKCTRCNEYGNTVSLTKIAIESMPSKTVYNIGDSLNTSGLKLKLTYSDASTKSITSGFTTSGFNSSTAGTKTITVSYGDKTTSFNVTVNSAAVDESSAQITVDSAKTTAGQTVQLCVKLKNNPGIAGLVFSLDYDKNALTLTNTSNGSLFDSFTPGKNFMWDSANNVTADGTLATFTFNVNENAEKGDYSISVTVRSCVNEAGEDVTLNVVGGKISVIDFKYGDANGDGNINMKDVVLLRQYIANYDYDTNTSSVTVNPGADANGDSKIDMKDVVILRQYIANYDYDTDTSTVVLGPQ
jgi:uncharacterized repeat protein (TIGR02543 family)